MSASSVRQAGLFELEDVDLLQNGNGALSALQGRKKSAASQRRVGAEEMRALLRDVLGQVEERLSVLEQLLRTISERLDAHPTVKDYYTTLDVAHILQKKPYTVREWCRLGRINGEKAHSGRGLDEEWRISHEELVRIQNEGLLPIEKFSRVSPPPRLPK